MDSSPALIIDPTSLYRGFAKFALAVITKFTLPLPASLAISAIVPLKRCCARTVVNIQLFGARDATITTRGLHGAEVQGLVSEPGMVTSIPRC